ncbi:MAG: RNA-binding protein [Anaerolineae bacterium]
MNHTRVFVGDISPNVGIDELWTRITEDDNGIVANREDIKSLDLHSNDAGQRVGQFAVIETSSPALAKAIKRRFDGHELKGHRMFAYTLPPKINRRPRQDGASENED